MKHADHVALLRDGVRAAGGVWADFGSGAGAFTLALADLIGVGGEIYSVDKDRSALAAQERAMRSQFPDVTAHYLIADFTKPLDLPPLDGAVMANSLHFVREKDSVIQRIKSYLRPGGRLLMVEYNTDRGNMWVPYPFSYPTWEKMASRNGFASTRLLSQYPSRFLNEIYSAVSW
jgi:SAM-dependent methyltransferase